MNGKLAGLAIMCFNPSALIKKSNNHKLKYIGLAVPALTFLLYFWQYGADRLRLQLTGNSDVALLCLFGLIAGPVLVTLTAAILKIFIKQAAFSDLVTDVGFTFSLPLLINFIGLLFNAIFDMNTSLIFGLTGVLFSIIPLFDVICSSVNKKRAFLTSLILISAAGAIYMICPAVIFMLKG